jgi:hypothetical protein
MAAVLLLVGRGLEEPCIVSQMLDLSATPSKPQYPMAAEVGALCDLHATSHWWRLLTSVILISISVYVDARVLVHPIFTQEPLLLYACGFEGLTFRRTGRAVESTLSTLQGFLEHHLVAAARTSALMARIRQDCPGIPTVPRTIEDRHVKLAKRHREPSVEERMKKWVS